MFSRYVKLKIGVVILIAILVCLLYYDILFWVYRNAYMNRVGDHIYVEKGLNEDTISKYITVIHAANNRNNRYWNANISLPDMYIVSRGMLENHPYGRSSYATTLHTLIKPSIIIREGGMDEGIIAHELNHATVYNKLGFMQWYKLTYVLPTWFCEGLAMQVMENGGIYECDSFDLQRVNVDSLEKYDHLFYETDMQRNYRASALEVRRWSNHHDINRFLGGIGFSRKSFIIRYKN